MLREVEGHGFYCLIFDEDFGRLLLGMGEGRNGWVDADDKTLLDCFFFLVLLLRMLSGRDVCSLALGYVFPRFN